MRCISRRDENWFRIFIQALRESDNELVIGVLCGIDQEDDEAFEREQVRKKIEDLERNCQPNCLRSVGDGMDAGCSYSESTSSQSRPYDDQQTHVKTVYSGNELSPSNSLEAVKAYESPNQSMEDPQENTSTQTPPRSFNFSYNSQSEDPGIMAENPQGMDARCSCGESSLSQSRPYDDQQTHVKTVYNSNELSPSNSLEAEKAYESPNQSMEDPQENTSTQTPPRSFNFSYNSQSEDPGIMAGNPRDSIAADNYPKSDQLEASKSSSSNGPSVGKKTTNAHNKGQQFEIKAKNIGQLCSQHENHDLDISFECNTCLFKDIETEVNNLNIDVEPGPMAMSSSLGCEPSEPQVSFECNINRNTCLGQSSPGCELPDTGAAKGKAAGLPRPAQPRPVSGKPKPYSASPVAGELPDTGAAAMHQLQPNWAKVTAPKRQTPPGAKRPPAQEKSLELLEGVWTVNKMPKQAGRKPTCRGCKTVVFSAGDLCIRVKGKKMIKPDYHPITIFRFCPMAQCLFNIREGVILEPPVALSIPPDVQLTADEIRAVHILQKKLRNKWQMLYRISHPVNINVLARYIATDRLK